VIDGWPRGFQGPTDCRRHGVSYSKYRPSPDLPRQRVRTFTRPDPRLPAQLVDHPRLRSTHRDLADFVLAGRIDWGRCRGRAFCGPTGRLQRGSRRSSSGRPCLSVDLPSNGWWPRSSAVAPTPSGLGCIGRRLLRRRGAWASRCCLGGGAWPPPEAPLPPASPAPASGLAWGGDIPHLRVGAAGATRRRCVDRRQDLRSRRCVALVPGGRRRLRIVAGFDPSPLLVRGGGGPKGKAARLYSNAIARASRRTDAFQYCPWRTWRRGVSPSAGFSRGRIARAFDVAAIIAARGFTW